MPRRTLTYIIFICLFLTFSCATQNKTQKGAAYGAAGGAAAGAIIGQILGSDTESTLWGAAIGAAIGGAGGAGVGKMMDEQEREMREALAASEAATIEREGNLLALTFKGDVTFDTDSTVVKPGLYSEIDRISNVLNRYPETLIRVEGHTDSTGTEEYNRDLSIRRASAVRDLLTQRGVGISRIQTVGFGENTPVATNDTQAGRQMNRRVEVKIAPNTQ